MSTTMSASTGMPYLKPNDTTVARSTESSPALNAASTLAGQLVDVEVGRVDQDVGVAAQVANHLALAGDPVEKPHAALQRMRPAGRLLPPHEYVVGCLEEQQPRLHALVDQLVERATQIGEEAARPHVDDDRDLGRTVLFVADQLQHGLQQLRRQVVDHEPAEVLQRLGRGAAAGAGHAGDDDQVARRSSHQVGLLVRRLGWPAGTVTARRCRRRGSLRWSC